jgi:hypothetical protein
MYVIGMYENITIKPLLIYTNEKLSGKENGRICVLPK